MKWKLLTATGLAVALALPAMAQSSSSSSSQQHNSSGSTPKSVQPMSGSNSLGSNSLSTSSSGTSSASNTSANAATTREQVKSDLEKAGFTDVQVVPNSFMVRAKDKQDRPVVMILNPDSVFAVTQLGNHNSSGSQGSGKTTTSSN